MQPQDIGLDKLPNYRYDSGRRVMTRCQSDSDGDCSWAHCPQLRDNEPETTGRHCPLDKDCLEGA